MDSFHTHDKKYETCWLVSVRLTNHPAYMDYVGVCTQCKADVAGSAESLKAAPKKHRLICLQCFIERLKQDDQNEIVIKTPTEGQMQEVKKAVEYLERQKGNDV